MVPFSLQIGLKSCCSSPRAIGDQLAEAWARMFEGGTERVSFLNFSDDEGNWHTRLLPKKNTSQFSIWWHWIPKVFRISQWFDRVRVRRGQVCTRLSNHQPPCKFQSLHYSRFGIIPQGSPTPILKTTRDAASCAWMSSSIYVVSALRCATLPADTLWVCWKLPRVLANHYNRQHTTPRGCDNGAKWILGKRARIAG